MSMIYVMQQANESTIDCLQANPTLITTFITGQQSMSSKQTGLFARLFGFDKPKADEAIATGQLDVSGEVCYLDKAWHGLHYLLSGSDWEGDPPAGFLLNGGTEVGDLDVGYGPARTFSAEETHQIHDFLQQLEPQVLRNRFDSPRMMELDIYPTIWEDCDDALDYLISNYETLREFVTKTKVRQMGMVVYLG